MPHSALYFPYIEVPDKPSLTRVLLYWDQLETIAPWAIPDLGERMEDLIDCGLVKRVEPEEHLPHIDGFEDGFVALLDQAERNRRLAHDGERGNAAQSYGRPCSRACPSWQGGARAAAAGLVQ